MSKQDRPSVTELMTREGLPSDASFLRERSAEQERKRAQRLHQETVVIPRLRLIGSVLLLIVICIHNYLLLERFDARLLASFGALQLGYYAISTQILRRFYREGARVDLGALFLGADVVIFVLAIYASGGERSWLLPVLCVRVADQLGTSQRKAFAFATWTVALHASLVLYLAFVEQRALRLDAELAKVGFIYLMNVYLSLAAMPAERQRRHFARMSDQARDLIDELADTTRKLEAQRARAEAGSVAKSTFLANMSHEIRTPLNAVIGMTELMLEEPLSAKQREMANTIESSGRSLLELINGILDMSKIEAGAITLRSAELDLVRVVESVVSPMRVLAQDKAIDLRTELGALTTPRVRGDELRLRQVLFNLIGNAIKFTERGQVTLRIETLSATAERAELRISVEDTGIGMTEEAATRVFAAFEQADESTTRNFGGTGLGLSISKALVAMMGGDLTVRTQLGEGSCFEFRVSVELAAADAAIEAARAAASLQPVRAPSVAAPATPAPRPRVLLAEDTEVNRVLLQKMLERYGCDVTTVNDGAAALQSLTCDHGFSLVFMDWYMPKLDGLDATRQTRQWEAANGRPRTPIIGFTASAFAAEVERCKQAGMDDVLSKPVARAQLEATLQAYLRAPQPEPAPGEAAQARASSCLDAEVFGELVQMELEQQGFLPRMLRGFIDRGAERMQTLQRAIDQHDLATLGLTAHSLKGSAGSLGARELARLCGELEQRAISIEGKPLDGAGDSAELSALLAGIQAALAVVNAELEQVLIELPARIAKGKKAG